MSSRQPSLDRISGKKIKQERSRKTYDTLVRTAFRLLKTRQLDSISVAELTRAAGYSVGAFYARFSSKNEFLEALVDHHVITRRRAHHRLFSTPIDAQQIDHYIADIVGYVSRNRGFWRSTLMRSVHDPEFWKPMRMLSTELASDFIGKLSDQLRRKLTREEELNLRFAFQITFGIINNTVINKPGPIQMNNPLFIKKLARAFRLVSDFENLMRDSVAAGTA